MSPDEMLLDAPQRAMSDGEDARRARPRVAPSTAMSHATWALRREVAG